MRRFVKAICLAPIMVAGFWLATPEPAQAQDLNALFQQAVKLYRAQRYDKAERLTKRLLGLAEKRLGKNHETTAIALNLLAVVYAAQGRTPKVEPLYKRSLAILEKALGPDHPDVAVTLHNLAELHRKQGRYAKAAPLHERSLAIREKALRPDHPHLADSLNNLALVYHAQDRYAEAEPLHKRSLAIRKKLLGSDHPQVAQSLYNLGSLYRSQGRYGQAATLLKRSLAIREKALKPDHPRLADNLDRLAAVYDAQGRYAKAEPLYKRSLAIRERVLKPDDPHLAFSLERLAGIYAKQVRYAEAEQLYKRSLAIWKKVFGADHPIVASTLNSLATIYETQGDYAKAERFYKRSLAIRKKALGPKDPQVAESFELLGILYKNWGRYAKAEPLYKRSLAIREAALGPDHPHVAHSLSNLAELLRLQGRDAEAGALYARILAIAKDAYGSEHPSVGDFLNNFALIYMNLGRYSEAGTLFKKSLKISERLRGAHHHKTALIRHNLALIYQNLGDNELAELHYKLSLATREETFGPEHPMVATSLNNLASLYDDVGLYGKAEPLYKRSLAIREKVFGADHQLVAYSLDNLGLLYLGQDQPAEAITYFRRAVAIQSARLSAVEGERSTIKGPAEERNPFFNLVGAGWQLGRQQPEQHAELMPETFSAAQWAERNRTGDALTQAAARFAADESDLADVVREREDLIRRWRKLDKKLIDAISASTEKRDDTLIANLRKQIKAAAERLDEIGARLARDFPAYAELVRPEPVKLKPAQQLLGGDEALVLFLPTANGTFIWAVTQDGASWKRAEINDGDLAKKIAALRRGLDQASCENARGLARLEAPKPECATLAALPFDAELAHELYDTLLGPVAGTIRDKDNLILVPMGALTSLPFNVLVTAPPSAPDAYAEADWLIKHHALTVLPSVSSLRALRKLDKGGRGEAPFIGFGDPAFQRPGVPPLPGAKRGPRRVASLRGLSAYFRGRRARLSALETGLPPLPNTARELRRVAEVLGAPDSDIVLGRKASETTVKRLSEAGRLSRYRVVHFATHALVAGEIEGLAEPALALSLPAEPGEANDGLLTASEAAQLKLAADWVVLSACNTAAGEKPGAQALSGLAKAFFYAGTRALLVSHWPVETQAGEFLATRTFEARAEDPSLGRAEALRRAMLALIDRGYAHPAYWAPYMVVGEGGAGQQAVEVKTAAVATALSGQTRSRSAGPPPPAPAGNKVTFDMHENVDLYGGDLRDEPLMDIPLDACIAACKRESQCAAFTYNKRVDACFLKTSDVERKPYEGAVSGLKQ